MSDAIMQSELVIEMNLLANGAMGTGEALTSVIACNHGAVISHLAP